MSFMELHEVNNRATPKQMCRYKHALQLHKLVNLELPTSDWVDLNFQQNFNSRTKNFNFVKNNSYKIGLNLMCNRLICINNCIEFEWMNSSFENDKIHCKDKFLKN